MKLVLLASVFGVLLPCFSFADVEVEKDAARAKVYLLKTKQAPFAVQAAKSANQVVDYAALASQALADYAYRFGVQDSKQELKLMNTNTDELGMVHLRYKQVLNNVPVLSGELIVHLKPSGTLKSITGNFVTGLTLSTEPTVSQTEAYNAAVNYWKTTLGYGSNYRPNASKLVIFSPSEQNNQDGASFLAWMISLSENLETSKKDLNVYVNANTGEIISSDSNIRGQDLYREVWDKDANGNYVLDTLDSAKNYYIGRSEGKAARGVNPYTDIAPDRVYDRLKLAHSFAKDILSLDGANNAGGVLVENGKSITRAYLDKDNCPSNAGYSSSSQSFSFCGTSKLVQLLGHEYGHAIVNGALTYAGESGGLEEAWADVNSYAFEAYLNGEASWITETQTSSEKPARYSKDPSSSLAAKQYPKDWYASGFYRSDLCNNVYAISAIATYASYLAAEGGEFNNCKTFPIGINKVHKVWYRAVKNYFPSNVTMNAAYGYLLNACDDLYPNPTNGNDLSATCYQLKKALLSVKMDQVGICLDPSRVYDKRPDCNLCKKGNELDCGYGDDSDGDGTPDSADECPYDPEKISAGRCGCHVQEVIEDADGDGFFGGNSCSAIRNDCNDNSYNATKPGSAENCKDGKDNDCDGLIDNDDPDCANTCPDDPNKTSPGICGCGVPDTDSDGDGTADCLDYCPNDPDKTVPGACGCEAVDFDTDGDGTADCVDECPQDPKKVAAGVCGCFVPDTDLNGNSQIDCNETCQTNRNDKTTAGACGCGVPDTDSDGDGVPDCLDGCPNNPDLIAPKGICGCNNPDDNSCGLVCTGVNNRYMGGSESHLNFPMNLYSEPGYDGQTAGIGVLKGAGDINGDGFEDIVIGHSVFGRSVRIIDDEGHVEVVNEGSGKVIIYFGSSEGIDQNNSYELTGTTSSRLGASVASDFDINGDGYGDLAISSAAGVVVYYGNDSNSLTKGKTLATGYAASAGDVNNDGYDDLIIGQASGNKVSLYYGSSSGIKTTAKDVTLTGTSGLGTIVAAAGDVNGDGFGDFIAAASSKVIVFLGKSSSSGSFTAVTLTADDTSEFLYGFSAASAGDVNGDGYDDVIVGSPTLNDGRVYLYFGAKNPLQDKVKFDGNTPTNRYIANNPDYTPGLFGASVSSAGDINGDGYSDIIIGSAGSDPFNQSVTYAGAAFLIYGQPEKTLLLKTRITGQVGHQKLGTIVSGAGDVNGDGYDDFLLSSNYAIDDTGWQSGLAYGLLYHSGMKREFGDTNNNLIPDCAECNSNIKELPGICGCSVQDVDSDWDGTPDCVDSCPNNYDKTEPGICGCAREDSAENIADYDNDGIANCNDLTPNNENEGSAGLSLDPVWNKVGTSTTQQLGVSVLLADFNGDNIDDIVFASKSGKIEAYYGSTEDLSATANWTVTEKSAPVLALANDINGDGYKDLLVGCPLCNSKKGLFKVYFGDYDGLSTSVGVTVNGTSGSQLGSSIAASDVNGDGYSDVIVGASGAKKAYLYLNNEGSLSSTPLTFQSGYVVAAAGDIDSDGYEDFLISNPEMLSGAGRSFLYYGKKSGTTFDQAIFSGWNDAAFGSAATKGKMGLIISAPNFSDGKGFINVIYNGTTRGSYGMVNSGWIYGNSADSKFGSAVAVINNAFADGEEDLVIAAPNYRSNKGIVYISPRFTASQIKLTIEGEKANELFGNALASGDMNGDGYGDLLVASSGYSSGKGRVELFIGGPKRSASNNTYISGGDLNGASGANGTSSPVESNTRNDAKKCTVEVCNGLDDDCDGVVDNGFNVGEKCSSGEGQCLAEGVYACDGKGGIRCMAEPKAVQDEICGNGIDEDCDGSDLDCNLLCSDSDGGKKRIKRGTVTYQEKNYKDRCLNRKVLVEYSCSEGEGTLNLYRCAAGCKAGRCKTKRVLKLTKKLKKKQNKMRQKQFGDKIN